MRDIVRQIIATLSDSAAAEQTSAAIELTGRHRAGHACRCGAVRRII
jgi:hypothetical protein